VKNYLTFYFRYGIILIYSEDLIREDMTDKFIENLPEVIKVDNTVLQKKRGRKTDIERRRKSTPILGKVRGKRDHYTEKEKLNAVCVFAVAGNSRRVAEITGVPESTIRAWKTTEWWNEAIGRIITEQDEELGSKLTKLVDKAVDAVNDRLENGNYVYNTKLDKLIRKPVDAKELAIVTAISIDKRQLLRGQPTSRTEHISQDERLKKLSDQFRNFANAKEITQDATIVGKIEESDFQEHQDGDETWETSETSDSDSTIESSWEEEDYQEEIEPLTVNELFSE
jgi:hypothetical protein